MNQSTIDTFREMMEKDAKEARESAQRFVREMLAIQLYALAVSKPVPVNEPEAKPDYEAIAKECVEKAELTAPYLFNELENAND